MRLGYAAGMEALLWPPFIEITAGGLGIVFALWSIRRRQLGKPMHPDAAKADVGLLVFSLLMIVVGAIRWLGL
jgi:hypothetical protein